MLHGVFGVDFGNDERHIIVKTERRGIVDVYGACLFDGGRKFFAHGVADCAKNDVHAFKCLFIGFLNGDFGVAEGKLCAGGTGACEGAQFTDGEIALVKNFQHFTADCAGRT